MSIKEPPLGGVRRDQPEADDLDRLLGAFFRSQMPSVWPPAPRTSPSATQPARRKRCRPLVLSRLVLAASVALLLVGQWLLPRGSQPVPTVPSPEALEGPGSASRKVFPDIGRNPDGSTLPKHEKEESK